MKKIIAFMLFFGITSMAAGEVSTRVCLADGTPFEPNYVDLPIIKYPDIMVGTKLSIIVWSDVAEDWPDGGALVTEDTDILFGRDCDEYECPGSILPAAGDYAYTVRIEYPGFGFEFYGGEEPNAGDWFIIDYNAVDIGYCNVAFYDYDISTMVPLYTLILHHVRTRDFDQDAKVDFNDYAILASYWLQAGCNEPGWCQGTDLDVDGNVDFNDLRLFCEFWLEKTE
ncbi:MAG: hypothetical protein WC454_05990 [Phycisphaerae bacterium]|jgi:hypothetical protein